MPAGLLEVQIHNVTDAIANLTEAGAIDPVVKATISLSESGFISVTDAVAYGEIKDDSITGTSHIRSLCLVEAIKQGKSKISLQQVVRPSQYSLKVHLRPKPRTTRRQLLLRPLLHLRQLPLQLPLRRPRNPSNPRIRSSST